MNYDQSIKETPDLFNFFYTTPRASADLLSDGGGPFGFDIHAAIVVDTIIQKYNIENIIETGTSRGDTTEYLARLYPKINIESIEIRKDLASFSNLRLRKYPNVTVHHGDSANLLKRISKGKRNILYYLDAHGLEDWPIQDEIYSTQNKSVIIIDDFNVNEAPFHYDTYNGVECNAGLIKSFIPEGQRIYSINLKYKFKYPCLQMNRRGGKAIILKNFSDAHLIDTGMFREVNYD